MVGRELVHFNEMFPMRGKARKPLFTGTCYLILSTSSATERWEEMAKVVSNAALCKNTMVVLNHFPCDVYGQKSSVVDAILGSHLFAIQHARVSGEQCLILEDDMYFSKKNNKLVTRLQEVMQKNNLPAGFLGGVYTSMRKTDTEHIFIGRALQAHAYIANPLHPAWLSLETPGECPMNDVRLYNASDCAMIHPAIAFQKPFPSNSPHSWPLSCLPMDITFLNAAHVALGYKNCYETCVLRTNALTALTGSLRMSILTITIVAIVLGRILYSKVKG